MVNNRTTHKNRENRENRMETSYQPLLFLRVNTGAVCLVYLVCLVFLVLKGGVGFRFLITTAKF
jgi:hypothetical protein